MQTAIDFSDQALAVLADAISLYPILYHSEEEYHWMEIRILQGNPDSTIIHHMSILARYYSLSCASSSTM